MTSDGIFDRIHSEFNAEKGTFLLKLRCELEWDKAAFARLLAAMLEVALKHNEDDEIPKWLAQGFWYLNEFIPDWSSHPDFHREFSDDYYDRAYEVVRDLADMFFMGDATSSMKTYLSKRVAKLSSE